MSTILDIRTKRLDKAQARKLIAQIVRNNPDNIRFSKHALIELGNDNLTTSDALNVIKSSHSRILSDGEWEHGSFRYRLETSNIMIVIAFDSPESMVIVTAWRKNL